MATTFREDQFVDDLLGEEETLEQARQYKEASIAVFGDVTFELDKWHSNIRELDGGNQEHDCEKTYAKQYLGTANNGAFLLGHHWNKAKDIIGVKTHIGDTHHPLQCLIYVLS